MASVSGWAIAQQRSNDATGSNQPTPPFPTAPRELQQLWTKVSEANQEQRFSEGASLLGEFLQGLEDHDYFVVPDGSRMATSYRSEILRSIKGLHANLLEQYEQRNGGEARQMLAEALESHNEHQLAACAHKWQLTVAGQQASLLLARLEFDRERVSVAVRRLNALAALPNVERLEPERSVLLARSLAHWGRTREAIQVWERLKQEHPTATFQAGDENFRLDNSQLDPELSAFKPAASGDRERPDLAAMSRRGWWTHRGDLAGTPIAPHLPSKVSSIWKQSRLGNQDEPVPSAGLGTESNSSPATVLSPLLVGNQVLGRGVEFLSGLDANHGNVLWSFRPAIARPQAIPIQGENVQSGTSQNMRAWERTWRDRSYGRISSDGTRVFFLEPREIVEQDSNPMGQARLALLLGQPVRPNVVDGNQLVALDVTRQGAFAWMVGGITGESEPTLAEAFFLGPPLPVGDTLYVLAEVKGQVRVAALSAATGRQRWSIALSNVDAQSARQDSALRFLGSSPAYADGILICPTSAGTVVAIDVVSRQIRWGISTQVDSGSARSARRPAVGIAFESRSRDFSDRDFDILIAGEHLVYAGNSEELICLELATGTKAWSRRWGDTKYIAVVGKDRLLLIGEHRLTAVRISDGRYSWPRSEFVAIPGGGSPSGRGLFDGQHFYLPTSDPELLSIDVADGTVVERRKLDAPWGNLAAQDGLLVSQTATIVEAFALQEPVPRVPQAQANDVDLATWTPVALVRSLRNDEFAQRERASHELQRRGLAALPPVADGLSSADPEVAFRCASLLIRGLDSNEPQVAAQSRNLLLAATDSRLPIAANAYLREANRRVQSAMLELQRLGGTVDQQGRTASFKTNWRGGSAGLAQLTWLTQLESLDLCHSSVNDESLAFVRNMSLLKTLNLHRSSVTSAGLSHLVQIPKLETLLLQGTRVDDSAIEHMAKLTQLKSVNLLGTNLSPDAVTQLQQKLPQLKILR